MSLLRFVAAGDVHGDMKDDSAIEILHEFTADFKPHKRIFIGDLWDFRAMRGKADEADKRESMQEDFAAGLEFLREWKPHHFIQGNHDFRLFKLAERATGLIKDLAEQGVRDVEKTCKALKCELRPYHRRDGVVQIGFLKFLHGFYCGKTAAKQHLEVYHHCVFGHTHAVNVACGPSLYGAVYAHNIGCLCSLDMEYDAQRPDGLKQEHGFAYGWINEKTGSYRIEQAKPIDGKWITPTDFRVYG